MVSELAVGIIVAIVIVVGGTAAYVLTRPSEAPETYDLFYDYKVGEYYVYETTTTTTMDDTVVEDVSSTYSTQVTAVEDNEITVRSTSTVENIGPPSYEFTIENAEVTGISTMTNKGEMISWEIESVVPPEYWENVELYENYMMAYSQLFESLYMFPSVPIPIGQEWETSTSSEIPWGPGMYMPLMGEGSTHFVGQESVTVEAGTFDCWRLDYGASISGELEYMGMAFTMDMTLEGTSWYSKQNCADVKGTMSMTMEFGGDITGYLMDMVTELLEYGTI